MVSRSLALILWTTAVMGLLSGDVAWAQDKSPPAYLLVEIDIIDPDGFQAYAEKVPATIAQHGGTIIVNDEADTIEGAAPNGRVIVLRFGNISDARAWLDSPDYTALKGIRHETATTRQLLVEGLVVE